MEPQVQYCPGIISLNSSKPFVLSKPTSKKEKRKDVYVIYWGFFFGCSFSFFLSS